MVIDPLPWVSIGPMKNWAELPLYPKEIKSHCPFIRARRRHVPWLAGIRLQSPLEAGNAFKESLCGWECLFKVPLTVGNTTMSWESLIYPLRAVIAT